MQALNITQLDMNTHNSAPNVDGKGLKYLNTIPDTAQYPAESVGMGEGIYMYQQSVLDIDKTLVVCVITLVSYC